MEKGRRRNEERKKRGKSMEERKNQILFGVVALMCAYYWSRV